MIVVGHEDRSWFSRLVEGSVSREVIRESDIPVLVVPYSGEQITAGATRAHRARRRA